VQVCQENFEKTYVLLVTLKL